MVGKTNLSDYFDQREVVLFPWYIDWVKVIPHHQKGIGCLKFEWKVIILVFEM
jgi:hypothetical protein